MELNLHPLSGEATPIGLAPNSVSPNRPEPTTSARDNLLLQRVARREPEARSELYDLYAAPIFGLCLRILHENQLAEEALQEVFVRVRTRAELFEPLRGRLSAWVFGIARNTCIDKLRRLQPTSHPPTRRAAPMPCRSTKHWPTRQAMCQRWQPPVSAPL